MKKIPVLLFYFLLIIPSYATEIDLSDFASGDTSSHSHVWQNKHDYEFHWQECQLCGIEQNKLEHSLSISYTISETSCDAANRRTASCSGCSFTEVSSTWPGKLSHDFSLQAATRWYGITLGYNEDGFANKAVNNRCNRCPSGNPIFPQLYVDTSGTAYSGSMYEYTHNPLYLYALLEDGTYKQVTNLSSNTYSEERLCPTVISYEFDPATHILLIRMSADIGELQYSSMQPVVNFYVNGVTQDPKSWTRNVIAGVATAEFEYLLDTTSDWVVNATATGYFLLRNTGTYRNFAITQYTATSERVVMKPFVEDPTISEVISS